MLMATKLVDGLSVMLLLARDTARTAAFYRDAVGLPLEAEEHGGRHKHYACQLGSILLHDPVVGRPGRAGVAPRVRLPTDVFYDRGSGRLHGAATGAEHHAPAPAAAV